MCARFITALFSCPDVAPMPASGATSSGTSPTLAAFIAYALHRTRLHQSVTFCALFLLSRLKGRFPAARGSSGHRLFISAFMIASKVICDDTYSNKSWCVVGQGMFSLREINQMEREMCSYLEWVLNVKPEELKDFEAEVKRDYGAGGAKVGVPVAPASTATQQPAATLRSTVSTAPSAAAVPRPVSATYPSPDYSPGSPSHSDSSSPASSEPRTPPTPDVPPAVAARSAASRTAVKGVAVPLSQKAAMVPTVQVKVAEERIPGRPQTFAFATAAEW